jgi:hypothetical protein
MMRRHLKLAAVGGVLVVALAFVAGCTRPRPTAMQAHGSNTSDVDHRIATAKTPADHRALAEYYDREAATAKANAEMHRKMGAEYRKMGGAASKAQLPEHCEGLVKVYESAAKDFEALARAHRQMADAAQ